MNDDGYRNGYFTLWPELSKSLGCINILNSNRSGRHFFCIHSQKDEDGRYGNAQEAHRQPRKKVTHLRVLEIDIELRRRRRRWRYCHINRTMQARREGRERDNERACKLQ